MKNVRNIGIDVGFGFTKAVNDKMQYLFPSIVGEARNIRYRSGMSSKKLLNNLVVEYKNDRYFVGELAKRQSEFTQSTLSDKRVNNLENEILFMTSLALLDSTGDNAAEFNLVTGLPVDDYLKYKDQLKAQLINPHKVKLIYDNETESKVIKVNNCKVIPQPFGTLFNQLLNNNGDIRKPVYANIKVGIIDIGFRTSDFVVADSLEFIDKLSTSSETALSTAYKLIGRKLNEKYNINKPLYQLEEIIRNKSFTYHSRNINIMDLIDKAYKLTANNIISEIQGLWPDLWEMEKVIITGGGGVALYKHLKSYFNNSILVDEGQFNNAKGYLKLCNRSF
ncbi:MAG: hypothetical protein ACOCRO_01375 [Halanaerobiales bacterium]